MNTKNVIEAEIECISGLINILTDYTGEEIFAMYITSDMINEGVINNNPDEIMSAYLINKLIVENMVKNGVSDLKDLINEG